MFTITTTATAEKTTAVAALGKRRRQRTVKNNSMDGLDRRHGLAVGALLNEMLDERQQAMLRHPSGGQRVTQDASDPTKMRWTVNV